MKSLRLRLVLWLGAMLLAVACATVLVHPPGVLTVYAQTLPATKTLLWDANPAGDAVLNYTVTLDAVAVGSPVVPSQSLTFATAGTHTIKVTAVNTWGPGAATTLTVNVIVPSAPTNLRLP